MRRNLEHRIGGGVDDGKPGAHVLLTQLIEDDGSRGGLIAQCLPADAPLVFGDHVRRKTVRIGAERILHDQPHHLPMTRGRIFPRAELGHAPERALRRLVGGRLGKRVQESEASEVGKSGMLIAQHVSQGVRSLVAKIRRIRQRADAEGVADQDDGPFHNDER